MDTNKLKNFDRNSHAIYFGTQRFLAKILVLEEVTWCKQASGDRIKVLCASSDPLPTV